MQGSERGGDDSGWARALKTDARRGCAFRPGEWNLVLDLGGAGRSPAWKNDRFSPQIHLETQGFDLSAHRRPEGARAPLRGALEKSPWCVETGESASERYEIFQCAAERRLMVTPPNAKEGRKCPLSLLLFEVIHEI